MPMNPVVCGLAEVAALGVTDPVAAALLAIMPGPIITWTVANVQASATMNVPLVAVGPAVVGQGGFIVPSTAPLSALVSAALGIFDAAGLSKVDVITAHYASVLSASGHINPTALIAFTGSPAPGPTTGTGGISLGAPFKFYQALGLTDAKSVATWTAFGNALQSHLESFGTVTPVSMTNPGTGGPVAGTGTLS